MNKQKLVGIMYENSDTQTTLANAIGISVQRLNAKINGTGGAEFNQGEIQRIKDRYKMDAETVEEVFFTTYVS